VSEEPVFAWSPWGTAAFSRAQAQRRPILLAITVPWSIACHSFLRSFADHGELAQWAATRFVPVLVDAERRPDISDRYAARGWPTLVVLNPVGTPLSTLPLDVHEFKAGADRLLQVFQSRFAELAVAQINRSDIHVQPAQPTSTGSPSAVAADDYLGVAVDLALAEADFQAGGFGGEIKFPADLPLRACVAALTRQPDNHRLLAFVDMTLDAMARSALWDAADGGVFRAATVADWSRADSAKLLDSNTALIDVYLESAHTLGRVHDQATAVAIATFVRTHLMHPDGGFFTALWHEDGQTRVDRTMRADVNARTVRAFFHVAAALGDDTWERDAVRTMERLMTALYERGAGLAHVLDQRAEVRGLVADQVAMAAAAIDTFFVTEGTAYCDLAEELMRGVWRKYWIPDWGLVDRVASTAGAGDMGLLATPQPAFRAGCEAVEVLERLALLTNSDEYRSWAALLWAWLSARIRHEGLDAGALALARLNVDRLATDAWA
jgi:uncharacterized protein YyaL (SSP411 family)